MDNKLYLSFGSISETGSSEEFNKDSLVDFTILDGHVFAVCDGHDGINGHGALASKLVTESIKKYFFNRSYKDMAAALTNAVVYANYTLFEQSIKDPKYHGIGSTLAILIFRGGKIYYAYGGDSRIYMLKHGALQLLTRDHHASNENAAEAEVTVLLGINKDIRFGVCKIPLNAEPDDIFMLCTDGLTDVVPDDEIVAVLNDPNASPEHKNLHLIDKVKNSNGLGNTSIQVIEFSPVSGSQKPKKPINLKPILIIGLITLLLGGFGYFGYRFYPDFKDQIKLPVTVQRNESDQDLEKSSHKKVTSEAAKVSNPNEIANNKIKARKDTSNPKNKSVKEKNAVKESKQNKEPDTDQNKQIGYYVHKIQAGENLYRLGLRYHVPQQKIIDINGTAATKMVTGQKLKIPITAMHTVGAGETLQSVSAKYKVKVNHIKSANKMEEESTLILGNELIIPLP